MRVIWSPRALDRAAEIARHIATDRPEAARGWIDALIDRTTLLGKSPELGRSIPELQDPDYRELLFGNYRIIYHVAGRRVEILTVWHARRMLDSSEFEP